MSKVIRIGTRDSELALWQANTVKDQLEELGHQCSLVPVKSTGDIVLDKPLYELGITGIFTKTLDIAMLTGQVDIAVHSMKDVPTALPHGIVKAAVLKRHNAQDILVHKGNLDFLKTKGKIATGSLRRKAQWLHRFPDHEVTDLRGNVNTRLQKLKDSDWDGAIFAKAGLERINVLPSHHTVLDWMLSAPAQGAMMVVALQKDEEILEALAPLNHHESDICTYIERDFLRTLEGGCTAPIGAFASIENDIISFHGVLHSLNGKEKIKVDKELPIIQYKNMGKECAQILLHNGGAKMMKRIKE
ncbi:hydroxymethylbilane synthase [Gangjinia marincola]|uniref:Hydroxymethylbilane synthase n=1 Tax=Gangjinia marincola TaxID=578463 RepID=A0ABP3XWN7_9FLAO